MEKEREREREREREQGDINTLVISTREDGGLEPDKGAAVLAVEQGMGSLIPTARRPQGGY